MPIYEYRCEKCEREFEVEQRITDAPLKSCPRCRSRRVKRLISQTSFVLKGSGWYSDLYSSRKAASTSESGAGDAKEAASADGKADDSGSKSPKDDKSKGDKKEKKKKGGKAAA